MPPENEEQKKSRLENLLKQSKEQEEKLIDVTQEMMLRYDDALVQARKSLLANKGSLNIKGTDEREYFKQSMNLELLKVGLKDFYQSMGQEYPGDNNTDAINNIKNRTKNMIMNQYLGLDTRTVNSLVDRDKDVGSFMDLFTQRVRPGLPGRFAGVLRQDLHEHLRTTDEHSRKYIANTIGLPDLMESAGVGIATNANNYSTLGSLVGEYYKNKEKLTTDIIRSSSEGFDQYLK